MSCTFREKLVLAAHQDWLDPQEIIEYKRAIGWRLNNPKDDWCGIWVGAIGVQVGLAADIAKYVMPSTYRLSAHEYNDPLGWGNIDYEPPEPVEIADVQRGDIVTMTTTRGYEYGDHIEIVYDVLHDKVYTYGGNTRGGLTSVLEKPPQPAVCRCVRSIHKLKKVFRLNSNQHMEKAT